MITAGSYSRLTVFETCPYQAYLKFTLKRPEPPTPAGTESPLERGIRVHKDAELYVRGVGPITPELAKFEEELYSLHVRYREKPESVELEQTWCFDAGWNPCGQFDWDAIWLRIKQDVIVHLSPNELLSIDHKTGKKAGNEVKHDDQLRLSLVGAAFKYPDVELFHTENWYFDQNELVDRQFTREQVMEFFPDYNARLLAMTQATEFPPRPSKQNCRFCPYRKGEISRTQTGTGECPHSFYER